MTFEEANDRYLAILKQISYIEDNAKKDTMYNFTHFAIGDALLRSCNGSLNLDTEETISFLEKMLSVKEDR